ncbi:carbohydrate kinase family protein, partial [Streptomyces cavourensis]
AGTAWGVAAGTGGATGCALATTVLEAIGTQEYKLAPADLTARMERAYGPDAARTAEPRLAELR